jgi:hypothetical protein
LDTVYFVSKEDDGSHKLEAKSFVARKSFKYGDVAKRDRRFIFDFNESFMLKLGTYL